MAQLTVIIALLALALTGCITTTTGAAKPARSSPNEAAGYNMQLGISYLRQNKLQAARNLSLIHI